jgi:hypothetical protein
MGVAKPIFKKSRLPRKHCLDANDMRGRQTVYMTVTLKLWVSLPTSTFSKVCKIIGYETYHCEVNTDTHISHNFDS